jgi:hypothetical protein
MALPKLAVPTYTLTIPSTGATVKFRPYLVGEEKILMLALESDNVNSMLLAITDVIDRCFIDNVVSTRTLKMFDIEYIYSQLKSKSVGETSEVSYKCGSCDEPNPLKFNLETDIAVSNLDIMENKDIKLSDTIGVKLKYPNITEVLKMEESSDIITKLTHCIDYIYEGDIIYESADTSETELTEFVESFSSDQFEKVTGFLANVPKTTLKRTFTCHKCKDKQDVVLEGIHNFF